MENIVAVLFFLLHSFLHVGGFSVCKSHLFDAPSIRVDRFEVFPEVPKTGEQVEFIIAGFTANELNRGAKAKVVIEALGVEVSNHEFDVCELSGVVCPIPAGEHFFGSIYHQLPEQVPEGVELSITVEFTKEKETLSCVERDMIASEGQGLTSARFGFDPREIGFLFEKWIAQHHFNVTLDLLKRKAIFAENLMKIALHNAAGGSWKMAMNQYGHMKSEEFKEMYLSGLVRDAPKYGLRSRISRSLSSASREDLPETVNWVKAGAVTPVKNQGACGSCWAFATTGALEGAYFLKHNKLVSFSEQQLVACDYVDKGCNGGFMDTAYEWIQSHGGLCTEEDYPYTAGAGLRGWCKRSCTPVENSAPSGYHDVEHDETSLEKAVSKQPVAIAIEADQTAFQFYSKGVLTGECGTSLNHGVLLVGYGTEDGQDYWLIKNSWGPSWGDEGYIKIARGHEQEGGQCGILLATSYPIL